MWWSRSSAKTVAKNFSTSRKGRPARNRLSLTHRALGIERLESRTLLAAGSIAINGSNVQINTPGVTTDSLTVALNVAQTVLIVTDNSGNTYTTTIAGATGSGTGTVNIPVSSITGDNVVVTAATNTTTNVALDVNLTNGVPSPGGTITLTGGTGTANALTVDESNVFTNDTITVTNNSISDNSTATTFPYTIDYAPSGSGTMGGGVSLNTSANPDTVNVQSTAASATTTVTTEAGGGDTINVSSNAPTNTGTLTGIVGTLDVVANKGSNELNVSESGSTTVDTVTLTSSEISDTAVPFAIHYSTASTGTWAGGVNFNASAAADTIDVNSTLAATPTTINGEAGSTAFNIQADALGAGAANTFNGSGNSNTFNLNYAANASTSTTTGTTLVVNGGAGTAAARNVVNINATADTASRTVGFTYPSATGGAVNVTGFGLPTPGSGVQISNTQEVNLFGNTANTNSNSDVATVTGPGGGAVLSVTPTTANAADVFLGGTPEILTPTSTLNNPGQNGGGTAPDLFLLGLAQSTGLNVNGGATGTNQLVVNAPTEESGSLAATSGWGGANMTIGVTPNSGTFTPLFKTSTIRTAGNAYDTIDVSDSQITIDNNTSGNLLTTNISGGFSNPSATSPAVTVNAGDEAGVQSDHIADDITVTPSMTLHFLINGGNPTNSSPGPVNGVLQGDQLNVSLPAEADVWSNAGSPPIVSINSITAGTQPVSYSSIERLFITPGNGVVNIIGDNNVKGGNQDDYFLVRGVGYEAFTLQLGGSWNPLTGQIPDASDDGLSGPIYFTDVTRINAVGGAANGFDINDNVIGDDTDPAGVNALDLTPYANNTPENWGIETYYNQGNPHIDDGGLPTTGGQSVGGNNNGGDGNFNDGQDLLVYNGVSGISDNIVVQPSASQDGQLFDNNAATNTPIAVVNYTANTAIYVIGSSVNGAAGDSDTLTLRGTVPNNPSTSGNNDVVVDMTQAGTATNYKIRFYDAGAGAAAVRTPTAAEMADDSGVLTNILYAIQQFSNFSTVNIDLEGGSNAISVIGALAAGVNFNIVGGPGTNTLDLPGAAGANSWNVTPSETNGSGQVSFETSADTAATTVYYSSLTNMYIVGGDSTGADSVTLNGAGPGDIFTGSVGGVGATTGTVYVDAGPVITLEDLGTAATTALILDGVGGGDTFNLVQLAAGAIPVVAVNGAGKSALSIANAFPAGSFTVSPSGIGAGTVVANATTTYAFAATTSLELDGLSGNDTLTVDGTAISDTINVTPGSTPDAGTIRVDNRVPITYTALGTTGSVTIDGNGGTDTLDVNGSSANETFNVAATTGTITLNSDIPIKTTAIANLVLNGLGGIDVFNLAGALPYTTTTVNADSIVNLTGATGLVTVDLGDNSKATNTTITGYGGTVTLVGVTVANLDAAGNSMTFNGTAENDVITYTPTGAEAGSLQLAGLDTLFNFTTVVGTFTINGGTTGVAGSDGIADEVIVQGTAARDLFEIDQGLRLVDVLAYNTSGLLPVTLGADVQTLTAEGLQGQNTFQVIPAAGIAAFADDFTLIDNLVINIEGSSANATNALAIGSNFASLGNTMDALSSTAFVVVAPSLTPNSGTVRVYNNAVQDPDINYQNITTVAPIVAGTSLNPNLLILGADSYEPNDTQGTAKFLGSGSTLQIQNASIFPNAFENPGVPADQDYYRVVAQTTGTLDFQVYFKLYSGLLPDGGQLDAQVLDSSGAVIGDAVFGAADFGALGATGDARVRIPAVAGQSYWLHIFGYQLANGEIEAGGDPAAINGYNATIINTAAPVPYNLQLAESVLAVTNLVGGSGYTSEPTIAITGAGNTGSGAVATAQISNGVITSITISGGTGYVAPVTMAISAPTSPTGVQATADVVITDTGDLAANTANSDSGRSQFDNITNDSMPTIFIDLQDGTLLNDLQGNDGTILTNNPPVGEIPIPFSGGSADPETTPGYNVAIFDGNNTQVPVGLATQVIDTADIATITGSGTLATVTTTTDNDFSVGNSVTIAGASVAGYDGTFTITGIVNSTTFTYASATVGSSTGGTAAATLPGIYQFTFPTALSNGLHNITAEVQMVDPSNLTQTGFGTESLSLPLTIDTVVPPVAFGTPGIAGTGLASGSDSGVTSYPSTTSDNVTNVTTPTFYGVAEADAVVRVYAQVQTTSVGITSASESGNLVTVVTSAASTFTAGNLVVISGGTVAGYDGTFTINTVSGTTFTYTDPTSGLGASTGGTATSVPSTPPATPSFVLLGTTTAVPTDGTNAYPNGAWTVTSTVNLNNPLYFAHDGLRNLVVTAEDPAGNISSTPGAATLAETLQLFVDTEGPQVSDVHVSGVPTATYNLFGVKTAPTFTIVNATDASPIVITTNVPNAFSTGDTVYIQGVVGNVGANGTYTITAISGTNGTQFSLNGSSGTGAYITGGKAADQALLPTAPTPLVNALDIDFIDQPALVAGFLHTALYVPVAQNPAEYQLVGDANGIIPIESATFYPTLEVAGSPSRGFVHLVFFKPLPDDRYTLTIDDSIVDVAGNELDGISNASQPTGRPNFPSGNGENGSNFVASFIVNSRPHIGTYSGGSAYLDLNGNNVYDPTNTAASNRDTAVTLGYASDVDFAGDFMYGFYGNQASDGFDKLAAYGSVNGSFRWLYTNDYGQIIASIAQPGNTNGQPISGNWGNGKITVGLYTGTSWVLDTAGNGYASTVVTSLIPNGYPIAGNFDDDPTGHFSFATYNPTNETFYFQLWDAGDSQYDITSSYSLVGKGVQLGANARPVAANMDQDGITSANPYGVTDVGLYQPDGTGSGQTNGAQWYWFLSANTATGDSLSWLTNQTNFVAAPLGQDLYVANFGNTYALPIVGLWDPPMNQTTLPPPSKVTVNMTGTAAVDNFSFAPGAAANTWVVSLNGSSQTFTAGSINVTFNGNGGRDTASITGKGAGQNVVLKSGSGQISGQGYSVNVAAPSISVSAGGGSGAAAFYGTILKTNVFTAGPTSDVMSDTSNIAWTMYYDSATGFQQVTANATPGSNDRAVLTDGSIASTLTASGATAQLASQKAAAVDYVLSVKNFGNVNVTLSNKASVKKVGTTTFLLNVH